MPASAPSSTALLTAAQVAERLGLPRQHVWKLARDGAIPVVRISPRTIRFHPDDLDLWIDRRTTTRPRGRS